MTYRKHGRDVWSESKGVQEGVYDRRIKHHEPLGDRFKLAIEDRNGAYRWETNVWGDLYSIGGGSIGSRKGNQKKTLEGGLITRNGREKWFLWVQAGSITKSDHNVKLLKTRGGGDPGLGGMTVLPRTEPNKMGGLRSRRSKRPGRWGQTPKVGKAGTEGQSEVETFGTPPWKY